MSLPSIIFVTSRQLPTAYEDILGFYYLTHSLDNNMLYIKPIKNKPMFSLSKNVVTGQWEFWNFNKVVATKHSAASNPCCLSNTSWQWKRSNGERYSVDFKIIDKTDFPVFFDNLPGNVQVEISLLLIKNELATIKKKFGLDRNQIDTLIRVAFREPVFKEIKNENLDHRVRGAKRKVSTDKDSRGRVKKKRSFDNAESRARGVKRNASSDVQQSQMILKKQKKQTLQFPSSCTRPVTVIMNDGMLECDRVHQKDELYVTGYIHDIMKCLKDDESDYIPGDYFNSGIQDELKPHMRTRLLDWLVDVTQKFEFRDHSLHLAVNLLDRYLTEVCVSREEFQLVGCVVLWLAAKYHEICIPAIKDFVEMADGAFVKEDMFLKECEVINKLDFRICVPTACSFAERFINVVMYYLTTEKQQKRLKHLTHYYIDQFLMMPELIGVHPSKLAAAAVFASGFWLDRNFEWTEELIKETSYTKNDLNDIVETLRVTLYGEDADIEKISTQAVYRKYGRESRGCVAKCYMKE